MTTNRPNLMDVLKTMNDDNLKYLSVALTRLVFRDGVAEDLHSTNASMDQDTMKALNIDVTNRMYSVLKAIVDDDTPTILGLLSYIKFGGESRLDWDAPEATLLKDFKHVGVLEHSSMVRKGQVK